MTSKSKKAAVVLPDPACTSLAKRLKFLRVSVLGASREKMSEWIGIPKGTIKHYETESRKPSVELLTAIAECVMTCSYFDWLFHGEVFRPVQIDPVSGAHNLSLLAKLAKSIPTTGPAVIPAELAAEIRTAMQKTGVQP